MLQLLDKQPDLLQQLDLSLLLNKIHKKKLKQ
jgi:hypothetical protein